MNVEKEKKWDKMGIKKERERQKGTEEESKHLEK